MYYRCVLGPARRSTTRGTQLVWELQEDESGEERGGERTDP
jgi:hypothetical protein